MKNTILAALLLLSLGCKKKEATPEPAPAPSAPVYTDPHFFYFNKIKGTGSVNDMSINGTTYASPSAGTRYKVNGGDKIIINANYPLPPDVHAYDSVVVDIFVDSLRRQIESLHGRYEFKI